MVYYKGSAIIAFSAMFMLIIPLATYFRYIDNVDIFKLCVLFCSNLCSIILFATIYLRNKIRVNGGVNYSSERFSLLAILSFMILVGFVIKTSHDYNLTDLAEFSELYRQNAFAGSGIYTIWIAQLMPLLILLILINNGWSRSLLLPILLVVSASLILGLRVFLWGVVLAIFLQLSRNLTIKNFALAIIGVFLLVLYKAFLSQDDSVTIYELIVKQMVRPDLHIIVKADFFNDSLFALFEYLPILRHVYGHEISDFKEYYVGTIQNINELMPYMNLTSGVALPAYVVNYNIFFVFSAVVNFLSMMLIYKMLSCACKSKHIGLKIIYAYLLHIVSLSFYEDVSAIYKLEELIFFVPVTYVLYFFIKKTASASVLN